MGDDDRSEQVWVVEEVRRRIAARDVAGALDRYTDAVVYEFPFAAPPALNRHAGKAAIERCLGRLMAVTTRIALENVRVQPCMAPHRVLAAFDGDWDLTNGRAYRNTYIAVIEFRDGRVQ